MTTETILNIESQFKKITHKINTGLISLKKDFSIDQKMKLSIFFFIGLFTVSYYILTQQNNSPLKNYLDSNIPNGFVLIPIEIINSDTILSIIGEHGVVDLYMTKNGKKTLRVARKIKIIQSNDNSQTYAALVKEDQSTDLLKQPGPFFAVVQNPKFSKNEIVKEQKRKIQINYQN